MQKSSSHLRSCWITELNCLTFKCIEKLWTNDLMFPIPLLQGPNIRQAYRYARQQGKFKWKVNTNTQGSRLFRLWIHISWIQQTPKKCTNEQDRSRCALRTWWEFTFCLKKTCLSVSKAIYLVRLWWRRWDWRWFHVCQGSFHQSHSSSPSAEALLPCKWTMERRPLEVCCQNCYIYYLSSDHSLFVFFEEIPLARENLQQILL